MTETAEGEAAAVGSAVDGDDAGAVLDVPLDAHLHTDLSADADVPVDVYAALARGRGVAEIAITDHIDFDARDPNFRLGEHARRERIVREAAERWDGRPHIRFGAEVTYERRLEPAIREYLAAHAYDYTIGSIHLAERNPLYGPKAAAFVAGRTHRAVSGWYWDEAEAAVRSGLFDTLGHLDVVKRWLAPWLGPFAYAAHADLYERVLVALVDTGVALEVNSSGLRQEAAEPYPPREAVDRFAELGGSRVVVGSDAHRADAFAFALADAYELIAGAGFEELAFRRGAERVTIGLARGRRDA
jgi:histidinol-phosphatase (PHP family)